MKHALNLGRRIGDFIFVRKLTDESVTSSTVLQDDNELFFPVFAREVIQIEAVIFVDGNGSGTPDFKYAFVGPSGTTGQWCTLSNVGTVTDTPSGGPVGRTAWDGSITQSGGTFAAAGNGLSPVIIYALAVIGETSGIIKIQWAQSNSSGTATTVRAHSYIKATVVTTT